MDDSIVFFVQELTKCANFYQNWSMLKFWLSTEPLSLWWPLVATGETDRPVNGAKTCRTKS